MAVARNWQPTDHLHIRGEHNALIIESSSSVGSPPHTWRTLPDDDMLDDQLRITSTYVENTLMVLVKAMLINC